MSRFPTAAHLASWAGICPGNHASAGTSRSGRSRQGSTWPHRGRARGRSDPGDLPGRALRPDPGPSWCPEGRGCDPSRHSDRLLAHRP
nr:transposase [Protofrankia coriariae]